MQTGMVRREPCRPGSLGTRSKRPETHVVARSEESSDGGSTPPASTILKTNQVQGSTKCP
jgi:hypothetical protein